jgi:4-amino-4-deoxy-L-arabinose transferase-like glycosyltransferase
LPLTVHIEEDAGEETVVSSPASGRLRAGLGAWTNRLRGYDLATWLFFSAIAVYLVTRLIGLDRFPIYFFTDEAIQAQSIIQLINNGYRDTRGVLFPTYFRNGEYYNLGLSVYIQWLPYILFGKSAILTRAVSVFVTLIAAVSVGIILRNVFKIKYWWTGTLFLSLTPAWFLHSRTAFETAEFTAFYAGALCSYLLYRYKSPRFLYLTVFLGALSFYTYSPAQLLVPLTALGLLASDWRYHWENRKTALTAVGLLLILGIPYARASFIDPDAPIAHLHTLYSYWFEDMPLTAKLTRYFSEFGYGLSPSYWVIPNTRDLSRHLMKDYGHIMLVTLPFALFGAAHILRNLHLPSSRAVLITLFISPAASALVQTSITRVLAFVVPAAILTSIGFDQFLRWVEDPGKRILELSAGPGPNPKRNIMALIILSAGVSVAFISGAPINRIAILGLAIILALQVSGILERFAQSMQRARASGDRKTWTLSPTVTALAVFILLSGMNLAMLNDALRNGPLWFRDYGLGGMQYGAFQVFDAIEQFTEENPGTRIIFSPDWANGTDVVAR